MLSPFNLPEPPAEILCREGDIVFQNAWDGGAPYVPGPKIVFKWQDVYWVRDRGHGTIGPYESSKDSLRSCEA
jgi:hypothetical protein